MVRPIPERYGSVTPHLVVRDAARAAEFYKQALGAEILFRLPGLDGKTLLHAELRIGDSIVLLGEESIEAQYLSPLSLGGASITLTLYCADTDTAFSQAVAAGGVALQQPSDMFWGDRFAQIKDPYGHIWSFATHVRDVTQTEMREALQRMSKQEE
ncbi:MAG: VOC family protein [Rhodovibrionaceae bacterium]